VVEQTGERCLGRSTGQGILSTSAAHPWQSEDFYRGTKEKVGRWLLIQRAPAERWKTFKVPLSI